MKTLTYIDIFDHVFDHFRTELDGLQNPETGVAFQFIKQSARPNALQDFVLIRKTTERVMYAPERKFVENYQIVVQATGHDENARSIAVEILTVVGEQFGEIILQTPDGKSGAPVTVAKISPINGPIQIGNIDDGLYQYSVNYQITHGARKNGSY